MKHKKKRHGKNKHWGRNRHHLVPKSRNGGNSPDNLLWIDIERHEYWHKVFGNRTLEEVIRLLIKLKELKTPRC